MTVRRSSCRAIELSTLDFILKGMKELPKDLTQDSDMVMAV
jgi:hypothetical protein